MSTRVVLLAICLASASPAQAWTQERPRAAIAGPVLDFVALHRTAIRNVRLARRSFRGAYHIPRFDQAEAEAEVHTQYRYRTPYLPYWVFP